MNRTAYEFTHEELQQFKPFREKKIATQSLMDEAQNVAVYIARNLIEKYSAKKVVLFGSLTTGNFHSNSDIDIAVWGIPSLSFYQAVSFVNGAMGQWSVDLVDAEDCSEDILKTILENGIELL